MGKLKLKAKHRLLCGDCLEVMAKMPPNSVDSIVTDPPYGIGFLGAGWDKAVPGEAFAKAALRVLKPGGHLIAFAATRTVHRLAVALEDAGFEIRDQIAWVQWMGMPHSLDISKSIGKLKRNRGKPDSDEATRWLGWGSDLKPAQEPAVLVRKPFDGSLALNVLEHGVGALNIDACRHLDGDPAWPGPQGIPTVPKSNPANKKGLVGRAMQNTEYDKDLFHEMQRDSIGKLERLGRWPANLYQCPKPPLSEKGAGVNHPTVKPVGLMRWLVRLVTPPGGTVLEPFAGSGSTLVAAEAEGFRVIAVEMEPAYCDIIKARMSQAAPDLEALRHG